ncbi:MAG: hypothetical protein V8S08_05140 [Lachnoclostridium sp.]
MGAIAGAMARKDNRLAYIADYPIYGSICEYKCIRPRSSKMVNPRAQVYLEWGSTMKDSDIQEKPPSVTQGASL